MKVAIVGSRSFTQWQLIWSYMLGLPEDTVIVSGGADGADIMGETFADLIGMKTLIFLPDWNQYGKSAGIVRNADIVNACDKVAAFMVAAGSNGTMNTIKRAREDGKPVEVYYEQSP